MVYDLTVAKHQCYRANGILVSNCDAFRYLAMCVDRMKNDAPMVEAPKAAPYQSSVKGMGLLG